MLENYEQALALIRKEIREGNIKELYPEVYAFWLKVYDNA